jgi:hypothetical protein
MKRDISKTIVFEFANKFTKQHIVTVKMPYLPFRAANGIYSRLYKGAKVAAAADCEKSLVLGKISFENAKTKRTTITLASGLGVDMPYDLTKEDLDILIYHCEGFKMSCKT